MFQNKLNSIKSLIKKIFDPGIKKELLPPAHLIHLVGAGDFKSVGEGFLKYFIELCGLKQSDKVLDIGCGTGRMAVPLTTFMNKDGRYFGFDIVQEAIDWCKGNITPLYPNFNFQLINVQNSYYNPAGNIKAVDYKFPFADQSFDFIFLTSVFTHMLPPEMENYLSEITRVLKINGRCFITFFLLNPDSLQHINNAESEFQFKYPLGDCHVNDISMPEAVVAYDESFILQRYESHSLQIKNPIQYGCWCGRKDFLSYQDIVIAVKK